MKLFFQVVACLVGALGSCPARAAAQAGPYAPVGAELLLGARPAEGLLVLQSGYRNSPYVDAEALVFVGASELEDDSDVMTVSVGVREPHGLGDARVGRFLLSAGAVRPVTIDGAKLRARAPTGSSLEAFAGLPVVPELGPRSFDWLAGVRGAQRVLDDRLGMGVSYVQRREHGELSTEEVGADVSAQPAPWLSLNGLGSWSVIADGLAEARASAALHEGRTHAELYTSRRIASRLMSATSLFSVLGAAPSTELGGNLSLGLFPRLDANGTLALEALGDDVGYRAALGGVLRLSAIERGELRVTAQRRAVGTQAYSGGSIGVSHPLGARVETYATLELAAPDHARGRGALWPWLRAGASYALTEQWLLALAVGGRATPEYRSELFALARLACNAEVLP